MRIGIDIRSTLKKKTGVGYYTINLVNSLARIDGANSYCLYSRIRPFGRSKQLPPLPGSNFCHRVDYSGRGPKKALKEVDLFHTSSYDLLPPNGANFVVTVHDLIPKSFPQGHTKDAIRRMEEGLVSTLERADKIIADSQCTKSDLFKWLRVKEEKVRVIYPGVDQEFSPVEGKKDLYICLKIKYNIDFNYILYVGTIEPRKNLKGLIRAYKILKSQHNVTHRLVISGMKGWMYQEVFDLVKELNLSSDITFTGYVPKEDLVTLYNLADVFVYPSFYEGAGLPILEAFACGVPVVTSNCSCMPEIAGEAAVFVDPHEPKEIADGVLKALKDEGLRSHLKEKGLLRAREFSWERTAREMLEVFEEVVK